MANMQPTSTFHGFLKLPLELRTMIYELVARSYEDNPTGKTIHYYQVFRRVVGTAGCAQLLRTCHAVYEEFLPVLYHGLTIKALVWPHLQFALDTIGEPGVGMVQHIDLLPIDMPLFVVLNNKREVKSLDVSVEVPTLRLPKALPKMPRLKTVNLGYACRSTKVLQQCFGTHEETRCETFAKELLGSKPEKGHFLSQAMALFTGSPGVEWFLKISSFDNIFRHAPGLPHSAVPYWVETRVSIKVDKKEAQRGEKVVEEWLFQDATSLKSEITMEERSCLLHSLSPLVSVIHEWTAWTNVKTLTC